MCQPANQQIKIWITNLSQRYRLKIKQQGLQIGGWRALAFFFCFTQSLSLGHLL